MLKKLITATLFGSLLANAALADLTSNPVTNSSFTTITDLLYNPGIGLSDFGHRSSFPNPEAARPTSKTAYYRVYWKEIEPLEGQIDTSKLDAIINTAARRGQVVGFRIMSAADSATAQLPAWLITAANADPGDGGAGQTLSNGHFFPNYDNPVIIDAAANLLEELGKRYNKNPYVGFVDVGMVGLWGEWHDGTGGSHMPTVPNSKLYLDMHKDAFPDKPLVMLIATDPTVLAYGVSEHGMGWRGDCWGNSNFFDSSKHTLYSVYPYIVDHVTGLDTAWETAPVMMEACDSIGGLYKNRVLYADDEDAYNQFAAMAISAINMHVSSLNTAWANEAIPEDLQPLMEEMLKMLGYRFELHQLTAPSIVFNGGAIALESKWLNVGNAPAYDAYRVSYRLRRADGAIVRQWISEPSNVKTWLPDNTQRTNSVSSYAVDPDYNWIETPAGTYKIDVALLWPTANEPAIALGTAGRRSDGWYEAGETKLVNIYTHLGVATNAAPTITVPYLNADKGKLIDGNGSTWWHNNGVLANGTFELDLKKMRNINRIGYLDAYPRSISVAVATEAAPTTWTEVSNECVTSGSTTVYSYCSFTDVEARYVKVYLDYGSVSMPATDTWMETREVQVLEVPASL